MSYISHRFNVVTSIITHLTTGIAKHINNLVCLINDPRNWNVLVTHVNLDIRDFQCKLFVVCGDSIHVQIFACEKLCSGNKRTMLLVAR